MIWLLLVAFQLARAQRTVFSCEAHGDCVGDDFCSSECVDDECDNLATDVCQDCSLCSTNTLDRVDQTCFHCCEQNSADYLAQVPYIDVDSSGFDAEGKFVVVTQFDHRINDINCWFEDQEDVDTRQDDFESFAQVKTNDQPGFCAQPWRSTPEWAVLRPILKLMDVTDLNLETNYRYESSVICEFTEEFSIDDKSWDREGKQEMPFTITIPDQVDVTAEIGQRLTAPTETAEALVYEWSTTENLSADEIEDKREEDLKEIEDLIERGTIEITYTGEENAYTYSVKITPEVVSGLYVEDREPGQFWVYALSEEEIEAVSDYLGDDTPDETTEEVEYYYFTPQAIILKTDTVAERDEVDITMEVQTTIERPWRFSTVADTDDEILTVTMIEDCEDPLDELCEQKWRLEINGNSICDGTRVLEYTIQFSPDLEPAVHEQYSTWSGANLDPLDITFSLLKDQFACAVKLDEVTVDAVMTVYETAAYADVKNEWRTAQTAFFRVEITTSQELDVVTTELVELDMTQKNAEDTDFTTNLVANKTPVDTVTVAGAPQSVNPSPYTRIDGDAYTVNFSLLLDLDLFTPFTSLESVTVTFDVNIEITYTPFDGGRRRMRRRLLQTRAQPNRSVSARTSRIIVINLTEDQTVEEVRVQLESEGKKVVVGSPNGDAAQNLESQQPSRRSRADGEMERAQAAKAEESSSDTDNGNVVILVVAALLGLCMVMCFCGALLYGWHVHTLKLAQLQTSVAMRTAEMTVTN